MCYLMWLYPHAPLLLAGPPYKGPALLHINNDGKLLLHAHEMYAGCGKWQSQNPCTCTDDTFQAVACVPFEVGTHMHNLLQVVLFTSNDRYVCVDMYVLVLCWYALLS